VRHSSALRVSWLTLPLALCGFLPSPALHAQDEVQETPAAPAAPAEEPVIIKREPLTLIDARTYRVPLQLDPIRKLELVAPVDGVVRSISGKAGGKVPKETSVIQLDDAAAALRVKRAKSLLQAAKIEKKIADAAKQPDAMELAQARLEAVEAELALEELAAQQLVLRARFAGELARINVSEGEYVRQGQVLAVLTDSTKLQVELPADRETAKVGGPIKFQVEAVDMEGKISAVMPLAARFDPLRELSEGLVSVLVEIDNAGGKQFAGQGVFTSLIPNSTVSQVPALSVANLPDGSRKVQVLRDNIVRTLPVALHSRVGTESVWISGPFKRGDELVVSASKELADGTPVRPAANLPVAAAAPAAAGAPPAAAPAKKPAAVDAF
jgi:multidrug efflux pump subunit AcrA (membrane-fusion protein)